MSFNLRMFAWKSVDEAGVEEIISEWLFIPSRLICEDCPYVIEPSSPTSLALSSQAWKETQEDSSGGSGSEAAEGGKVLRGTKEKWNVRAQVELLN